MRKVKSDAYGSDPSLDTDVHSQNIANLHTAAIIIDWLRIYGIMARSRAQSPPSSSRLAYNSLSKHKLSKRFLYSNIDVTLQT